MENKWNSRYKKWQVDNCTGCMYADGPKIGTGEACCTFAGKVKFDSEFNCETKKVQEPVKNERKSKKVTSEEMVNMMEYSLKNPKSICKCGHTGDGAHSDHGGVGGHGVCTIEGCDCEQFTWKSWVPEVDEILKNSNLKRRK